MKLVFSAFLFIFSLNIWASDFRQCQSFENNQLLHYGKSQIQVVKYDNGSCLFSLSNRYSLGLIYRSFLFNNKGDLIVFNSFGPGNPSTDTGARSYTFLPLNHTLAIRPINQETEIEIKTTSGRVFTFDSQKTKILNISDADFIEADEVRGDNQGGLEITPSSGLILDEGWRQGGLPRVNLGRLSNFKDGIGGECAVKNNEIFKYFYDQAGRVNGANFIYLEETSLREYLALRCPEIHF